PASRAEPRTAVTIHLDASLPMRLSRLPPGSSEQLPNTGSGPPVTGHDALLSVGFTQPPQSLGTLVRSYRTVSPLPRLRVAVYFLLHLPAGHPGLLLAITVLYKVRTFLGARLSWPAGWFDCRVHPADSFEKLF